MQHQATDPGGNLYNYCWRVCSTHYQGDMAEQRMHMVAAQESGAHPHFKGITSNSEQQLCMTTCVDSMDKQTVHVITDQGGERPTQNAGSSMHINAQDSGILLCMRQQVARSIRCLWSLTMMVRDLQLPGHPDDQECPCACTLPVVLGKHQHLQCPPCACDLLQKPTHDER